MKERLRLVQELQTRGAIRSGPVAEAFRSVPREAFIPGVLAEHGLTAVYRDDAHVTKRDADGIAISSSSQPGLMAEMLELLGLGSGARVLEVGAGTGYNAALIRHIVGARGRVTTIDVDPQLARGARRALRASGYPATVVTGDGRRGSAAQAPFDRIIVTACADEIAAAWRDQLVDGGRLELPLRLDPDGAAVQLIPVFERRGEWLHSIAMTWGSFMALRDAGNGGTVLRPRTSPGALLTASRSVRGRRSALGSVRGGGLERLSERASRELLAAMIAGGGTLCARGETPMGDGETPLLLVFLLLNIPARRRITLISDRRQGIGLVDRAGASAAVFSVRSPWSHGVSRRAGRARWRLDAYGGRTAVGELEGRLREWRRLGRGRSRRLSITAYGAGEVLKLRFRWDGYGA